MFMGEYQHSIDPKGRIIIPARFREELGTDYVLARGLDRCLFAYTLEAWKVLTEKLAQIPFTNAEMRSFNRHFFGGASPAEVDKQGRSLIPPNLREYAALNKDIVIIGVSSRFEIWDKGAWIKYSEEAAESYEANAEKLTGFDLGIL